MHMLFVFLGNKEDKHEGHMDQTVKVLVIHNPTAVDVSVVIEGIQVLNGCGNKTKAYLLVIGLIYDLNLAYIKMLKYTCAIFQKLY